MLVKGINKSSVNTKAKIKKAFVELMYEKKRIADISVSELTRRIDINRSTFYMHYTDLLAVSSDIENDVSKVTLDYAVETKEDVSRYIEAICDHFYENREIYSMLLSTRESMHSLARQRRIICDKLLRVYQKYSSDGLLVFKLELLTDGMAEQFIRYFRGKSEYSFKTIRKNFVECATQLFPERM